MSGPVSRIGRLVSVEAMKVAGGRMLKIGLVATAAVPALSAWLHERREAETAWTVASQALSSGLFVAEIFLLVAGAVTIAGETGQGTLKMILPHAYRRSDWVIAKALALVGQAVLLLAAAAGAAFVAGLLSGGFKDVTQKFEGGFGNPEHVDVLQSASDLWARLGAATLVAFASLVATGLLGLLVSCLFDGVVPALCAAFLVFLGFKSAGTLLGASPEFLSRIYATYPGQMLSILEKQSAGFAERWDPTLLGKGALLAGIVAAVSVVAGAVVFSRRDLQA
jgi:ABC-type transport system involved in multi-copper enzyme maturation permease subunit